MNDINNINITENLRISTIIYLMIHVRDCVLHSSISIALIFIQYTLNESIYKSLLNEYKIKDTIQILIKCLQSSLKHIKLNLIYDHPKIQQCIKMLKIYQLANKDYVLMLVQHKSLIPIIQKNIKNENINGISFLEQNSIYILDIIISQSFCFVTTANILKNILNKHTRNNNNCKLFLNKINKIICYDKVLHQLDNILYLFNNINIQILNLNCNLNELHMMNINNVLNPMIKIILNDNINEKYNLKEELSKSNILYIERNYEFNNISMIISFNSYIMICDPNENTENYIINCIAKLTISFQKCYLLIILNETNKLINNNNIKKYITKISSSICSNFNEFELNIINILNYKNGLIKIISNIIKHEYPNYYLNKNIQSKFATIINDDILNPIETDEERFLSQLLILNTFTIHGFLSTFELKQLINLNEDQLNQTFGEYISREILFNFYHFCNSNFVDQNATSIGNDDTDQENLIPTTDIDQESFIPSNNYTVEQVIIPKNNNNNDSDLVHYKSHDAHVELINIANNVFGNTPGKYYITLPANNKSDKFWIIKRSSI